MICPECGGKGTGTYGVTVCGNETSMLMRRFEDICHTCHGSGKIPQTNADRIRAMSDEELAAMLRSTGCPLVRSDATCKEFGSCRNCWLDYLRQPVKDGEDE